MNRLYILTKYIFQASLKRAKSLESQSSTQQQGGGAAGPSLSKKVGLFPEQLQIPPPPRLSMQGNLSNAAPCNLNFSPEPRNCTDFGVSNNTSQIVGTDEGVFSAARKPPVKQFDCMSMFSQSSAGTMRSEYISAGKLPGFVKRNILRLLQKFPSGIPASELATKYRVGFLHLCVAWRLLLLK
jgi:hypothetical protein